MRPATPRLPSQRANPRRRSETRERIVEAAGLLFRQHGVDGVGVDAVMRRAGLTHGGFYLHFASKEALIAEVAQALLARTASHWDDLSHLPDRDLALRHIVAPYLSLPHAGSPTACPLTTLGPDVARRAAVRTAIDGPLRGMRDSLARCLPDPTQASATLATMVGAVVLASLADDPALAAAFLAAASASILPAAACHSDAAAEPAPSRPEALSDAGHAG